jgi:hypothetical protein
LDREGHRLLLDQRDAGSFLTFDPDGVASFLFEDLLDGA